MPEIKAGPLTVDELRALWEAATDRAYRDPFIAADEGNGFEAWTQLFHQLARASRAIDVTTQALFISPWSGQTNPPASGARKSLVTLSFVRTARLDRLLVLGAGMVYVEEETLDAGENEPVTVRTGRRYVLIDDLVFHPGEMGPFDVQAEAERPGYGYDNPLPGALKRIVQVGAGFENDLATVDFEARPVDLSNAFSSATLLAANQPDMFVPDHLGQYVVFQDGSNAGQMARIVEFVSPDVSVIPHLGSKVTLELGWSVDADVHSGEFFDGEVVAFDNGGPEVAYGRVLGQRNDGGTKRLAFVLLNGDSIDVDTNVVGTVSGATMTIRTVLDRVDLADEAPIAGVGGATWRILDWEADWGLTASNVTSPFGGRSPMLDELGNERRVGRAPGEDDESYRARVREIADVVSPHSIRRALNRILGSGWCLREVGGPGLPGFFFDGTGEEHHPSPHGEANDAYDVDTVTYTGSIDSGTFLFQERVVVEDETTFERFMDGHMGRLDAGDTEMVVIRLSGTAPSSFSGVRIRGLESGAIFLATLAEPSAQAASRRYRTWLDYEQFRGFFLITLPPFTSGEFGFAYDATSRTWGWDLPVPWAASFDGYPRLVSDTYRQVYDAVEERRAGGVGWELRLDSGPCP